MKDLRPSARPPDLWRATDIHDAPAWDLASLPDSRVAEHRKDLASFVDYLNSRYAWTLAQAVPLCWAEHGGLVEELTTLMWSRWAAFAGPSASPEAAQTWHGYSLAGFLVRMDTWLGGGRDAANCRAGNHKPSVLPSAWRPEQVEHSDADAA